jgi:hypothetical protein
MIKVVLLFSIALLTGCGGSATIDSSAPATCAIDSSLSARPEETCLSNQFLVMACTGEVPDPGGIECVPPKGPDGVTPPSGGTLSRVWCCK